MQPQPSSLLFRVRRLFSVSIPGYLSIFFFVSTGCSEAKAPIVNLNLQVEPAGQSGVYTVSGSTNLPEQSRINVSAIRYLSPSQTAPLATEGLSSQLPSQLTYTVLSRQNVVVNQGKWQTSLKLWQVAPNGQFQESWQLNQPKLKLPLTPAPDVVFLATFEPASQLPPISQQMQKQGMQLEGNLVRSTTEGQRYLQASQTLPIALPTGKTTPPTTTAADLNGGWGDRSQLRTDQPSTTELKPAAIANSSQTTAPLSQDQQLR